MRFVPHQVFSWFSRLSYKSICVSLACIYHLNLLPPQTKSFFSEFQSTSSITSATGVLDPTLTRHTPSAGSPPAAVAIVLLKFPRLRYISSVPDGRKKTNNAIAKAARWSTDVYTGTRVAEAEACAPLWIPLSDILYRLLPRCWERGLKKWWSCCEGHTYLIARPKSSKFLDSYRKKATISVRPVMT